MPKKLRWPKSPTGCNGRPWKNWRLSRNRIRCWPGTESSSPTSSTDRSFANPRVVPELTRKPSGWWCGWRRKIPGGAISSVFLRTSVARRFGGAEQNSSSAQTVRGFSRGTISRVGASNCRRRFGNGARTLRICFSSSQAGDGRGPRPRPGRILPLLDKSPRRESRGA